MSQVLNGYLAVSVGVAQSKFVAKVVSEESKPDGLIVVDIGTEFELLRPLLLSRIWGAGPVAQERMHRHGFQTIGDLQRAGLKRLEGLLGDKRRQSLSPTQPRVGSP